MRTREEMVKLAKAILAADRALVKADRAANRATARAIKAHRVYVEMIERMADMAGRR